MSLYPDLIERDLAVDGTTVRVYDSGGRYDTPTIVLVHGAGGTAEGNFWALFPMLAFEHRVVSMDLAAPAAGRSVTMDDYVRQVAAVIESVGDARGVLLVGYSLGAAVAVSTAAERPERVESLVTVGGWARSDRSVRHYAELAQRLGEDAPSAMSDFRVFASYSPGFIASRIEADYLELKRRAAGPPLAPAISALLTSVDVVRAAESLRQPALVIGCAFDQVAHPRLSKELFGAIENARYAEVQSGHGAMTERPAEIFALIDSFAADRTRYPAGTIVPQADW